MAKAPTVWMRALRPHTYMRRPIDTGDVYLAHEDSPDWGTVENIINLKFAVRDHPPLEAVRPSVPAESLPPVPVETPPDPLPEPPHVPSATSAKSRKRPVVGRTIESLKGKS